MPSLSNQSDRHTVIDGRSGHYICFPDVVRMTDGRLLVAYNEFERHVGSPRRKLLLKTSRDEGRTWSRLRRMPYPQSHCPRLTRLSSGELLISDDAGPYVHRSRNNGRNWNSKPIPGLSHGLLDRILQLGPDVLLTAGHMHRGVFPHPAIRQPPSEQLVFRSEDRGRTWKRFSVLAALRNLVLCEASMCLLPDGRLAALMRENSFVYEPMYLCISEDQGGTWSSPMPTPLVGHRPTMGVVDGDRLLVTYRDVSPNMGTCAWLGSLDELVSDFKVHGRRTNPANHRLTQDALRVTHDATVDEMVRFALRPLTDPRTASATLEAEVRVHAADENGCGMRLGCWWSLFPDRIAPNVEGSEHVQIEPGRSHLIRLVYADGRVDLHVDGERKAAVAVDPDHADTRPILLGAPYPFEDNMVDVEWRRASLRIDEPAFVRRYRWNWSPTDGMPDAWKGEHVLELMNDRFAAAPDFGYSGWTELEDGSVYCVYHHGGGHEKGYVPMETSRVMGTRFSLEDFKG